MTERRKPQTLIVAPVPPLASPRVPLTASAEAKFTVPKVGWLLELTVSMLYCVPAAVDDKAELDPITTPLLVNAETPVPPLATANVPVLRLLALIGGRSPAVREPPLMTRPLLSVVTFV